MKALWIALAAMVGITVAVAVKPKSQVVDKFGEIKVFTQKEQPELSVFILNDDPAWQEDAEAIGGSIAADQNLAVVIDLSRYIKQVSPGKVCNSIGNDLDGLNKQLQKQIGFKKVAPLVIVGHEMGADAIEFLSQTTKDETFSGFLAINSCSKLATRQKLCPTSKTTTQTVATQNPFGCDKNQHADADTTSDELMKTHRDLRRRSWIDQVKDRIYSLAALPSGDGRDKDVATVELFPKGKHSDRLVVLYSGDGGWATFVRKLSDRFNAQGIPVLGINSLKYFWNKKTPDDAAKDLEDLLAKYQASLGFKHIQLIGFSFGADVIPSIASRLPEARKNQIDRISLLSLGQKVEFEFHLSNWISDEERGEEILPQIQQLGWAHVDCLFGQEEESDSACPTIKNIKSLKKERFHVQEMPGGHFLNWDTEGVLRKIQPL